MPQPAPGFGSQAQAQPPRTVGPDPALMSKALEYERQANEIEQARSVGQFIGVPAIRAGDPAALRQAAAQYRQAALAGVTEYQKSMNTTGTIRGPGSAFITPDRSVVQSPLEYEVTGPDYRKYRITQNAVETPGQDYVRPPGVPAWAPSGTLSVALAAPSTGETHAMEEASQDAFGEKARGQYASAAGTMRAMEDLEQQFDSLNAQGPGWFTTGSGAQWKLEFGKTMNGIAQSVGAPPIYNPEKLAAGEDMVKQTKLAGMQTLATFFGGQREAASIVQSTQGAVPGIENTPMGGKLVLNGIREAARWQMDQHTFMTNWFYQHAGNMVGADVAFSQKYPPQMYTRRAISQVRPYEIPGDDPKELQRYLPGTQVTVKSDPAHAVRTIPGEDTLPLQTPAPLPTQGQTQ
jgi:hypothetical protein